MPPNVANGAAMMCSFGVAPSSLIVLPTARVITESQPAANIMDFAPVVNIPPFGMCTTPSNPMVASATAAALGVLTPMPCLPATTTPWAPGAAKTMVGGMPALTMGSTCNCAWGGVIQINFAATTKTMSS